MGFRMKVLTSLSTLQSVCIHVFWCGRLGNVLNMYNSAECTLSLFEYQNTATVAPYVNYSPLQQPVRLHMTV